MTPPPLPGYHHELDQVVLLLWSRGMPGWWGKKCRSKTEGVERKLVGVCVLYVTAYGPFEEKI